MNKSPEERAQTRCYVARKKCGCMVGATVDEPEYAKDTAKEVAKWIRNGLTVEVATVEVVRRELLVTCPHEGEQEAHS